MAVDHKLRNGSFAGVLNDFLGCAGELLNVDLLIGNLVLGQPALGLPAVMAPWGRINNEFHTAFIVMAGSKVGKGRLMRAHLDGVWILESAGNWRDSSLRLNHDIIDCVSVPPHCDSPTQANKSTNFWLA
jgi:hypothetical protein